MNEIERFDCEDEDGRRYTIVVRQSVATHRPLSGSAQRSAGTIDYVLDDGSDVTPLGDGQSFKILDSGVVIRSIL